MSVTELDSSSQPSYADNDALWFLDGVTGEGQPLRRTPILSLPFLIGRRSELGLSLASQMISGRHAEIYDHKGELRIRDLGSMNGTYVNGKRVEKSSPVVEGDIIHFAKLEFRLSLAAAAGATSLLSRTIAVEAGLPELMVSKGRILEEMMRQRSVATVFQPIVSLEDNRIAAFEVLGRGGREGSTIGSSELFKAASVLGAEVELSRLLRERSVEDCRKMNPAGRLFFINTHPNEIGSPELIESLETFRSRLPDYDVVLEVHEASTTDPQMIRELRRTLSRLEMKLAYDDFGSGQARFLELAETPPDFLKFDLSLIHDLDTALDAKQKLIAGLLRVATDLGIPTIAEGIETEAERATCAEYGFDFGQGYLFGKPAPASAFSNAADGREGE
ncbi:MAG: EAL domain-containing protein [Acidobacteriota bacterium]|nr:EAL domain-containing protein [Acidobacteriota bacterium]